jgi:predicted transcriptional regulator of viral defense system/very-short-patch-repair endonuclease
MFLDSDRILADIASNQDGVFTTEDARRAGLAKPQVDRRVGRSWSLLYDGVYRITGAPATRRSDLRAAASAAGEQAAISHRSAAALYELPGGRTDLIELTCIRWKRTVHPGLVVHESRRIDSRDIDLIDGIPVTTPERTLLDLASLYRRANYLEFVIQAARRKRLLTYESTKEMFDRHARRGLKGVAALREALERWNPDSRPTESEMETLLLQALRKGGLPEPVVQHDVVDTTGLFVARCDAAYPALRIAIEYDSKQEHSDEFQVARDARRRNRLYAAGYAVISARHADLKSGGTEICDLIAATMHRTAEPA